jgi:hypothetical protein
LPNDFTLPLTHRGLAAPLVDTCHNFGRPTPINLILVSRHFRVLDAAIDKSAPSGHYPSDHYPLTSVLTLIA